MIIRKDWFRLGSYSLWDGGACTGGQRVVVAFPVMLFVMTEEMKQEQRSRVRGWRRSGISCCRSGRRAGIGRARDTSEALGDAVLGRGDPS